MCKDNLSFARTGHFEQSPNAHRHQCQRLCWYRKPCGRYSFYTKNDSPRDNCVLHLRQQTAPDLVDGWVDEEASGHELSPDHGCSSRPCGQHAVCIPVYGDNKFMCANMSTGPWLGQSCTGTCNSPLWAGKWDCFLGQCLCAPGHYYSVSRRTCLETCDDFADSYLRYQYYDLNGYDLPFHHSTFDVAECKVLCTSNSRCLTFVYKSANGECWLKYVTKLTNPGAWTYNKMSDTYQKTCV